MNARPPAYAIFSLHVRARRFSYWPAWFPFGKTWLLLTKETTWQDAEAWGTRMADTSGIYSVDITWSLGEDSPL